MMRFVQTELMEGYLLQVRHLRRGFGRLIQRTLRSWAGHDAMIVRTKEGVLMVGDTVPFRARATSLEYYEKLVEAGNIEIRILAPADYLRSEGMCASDWWLEHELGTWYDFAAYPLLLIKAFVGDSYQWGIDLKWDWCSEGCMKAWLGGSGKDYWRKRGYAGLLRPTPLTTQHRMEEGVFIDVTARCVETTDEVLKDWLNAPSSSA